LYATPLLPLSSALAQVDIKPTKENTMNKIAVLLLSMSASTVFADVVVSMNSVSETGVGISVGQVTISESKYGLVFTPSLQGLTPGIHGFHLHQNASCEPKEKEGKMVAAGAAGGHYDPAATNIHGAPWGEGHLGDLSPLYVEANGSSTQPVLAPRLKLSDLSGRTLIVHAGGDNHSDHPAALGGGGARVSCGVIK
jgi:Cu-Zn family superoxide dismutase